MSVVDDDVFETCRLGVVEWERLKRCTESVCEKCLILIYHVPVHNTLNLTHLTTSGERGWAKQTTSSSVHAILVTCQSAVRANGSVVYI